jgi:hypothetical protein
VNTYTKESTANESQSAANVVSTPKRTTESLTQLTDNRPEAVAQRMLQEIANKSTTTQQTALAHGRSDKSPIQRMVQVSLQINDKDKKAITASGKVKDFKKGSSAGKKGWIGVTKYRSRYSISDAKYENTGNVGPLNNDFTNPEAGHVLALQNGGNGKDPENIFAQDGGTNNSTYKIFENKMRADLNLYNNDDDVVFVSYLAGDKIKRGTIADQGLDSASDISSEDLDL